MEPDTLTLYFRSYLLFVGIIVTVFTLLKIDFFWINTGCERTKLAQLWAVFKVKEKIKIDSIID